jgi:peptidyl-prolyl cis-trans isomerase C
MIRLTKVTFTLIAATLLSIATAHAAGPLASVNGTPIPQSRFDTILKAQLAQGQADTPELRNAIKENLIRMQLMTQEAEKMGLDKKPEVATQIAMNRQNVLIGAYLQEYFTTHPVTDATIQAEYDKLSQRAAGEKEYKVRHILVDGEDEAKALITKLKGGAKIEDLAKDSKDPGSKANGGDLGWANKASYVKPFSDAVAALEKGKYTEMPVKTDFGWHVILLEDVRDMKVPALEELKPRLTQLLQQQIIEKQIEDLRAKAKVQ